MERIFVYGAGGQGKVVIDHQVDLVLRGTWWSMTTRSITARR